MMEGTAVLLDDGSGKEFDAALRGTLKDGGNLRLITKDVGTDDGNPIAMLTFTVGIGADRTARAQTVVSVKMFLAAAKILAGKYPDVEAQLD